MFYFYLIKGKISMCHRIKSNYIKLSHHLPSMYAM